MCLLCFRVRLRRRRRRRRGDPLSAHFLGDYLVDLDQTSQKYSLGQGGLQAMKTGGLDLLFKVTEVKL